MSGPNTPLTPLRFLERTAYAFPFRVGVIDGRRRITWAAAERHVTRLAHAIRDAGVAPGEHVVYLSPNSAELVLAHFAVPLAGAVLVVADTDLPPAEVAGMLAETSAALVMVDAEVAAELDGVLHGVQVVVLPDVNGDTPQSSVGMAYADFLASASDGPLLWSVTDDEAAIAISYAATVDGRHRSLRLTHREAYLNALDSSQREGLDPRTRYLWTRPLAHCNTTGSVWAVTAAGDTHVCARSPHGAVLWRLVTRERITHTPGTPRFHLSGHGAYAAAN